MAKTEHSFPFDASPIITGDHQTSPGAFDSDPFGQRLIVEVVNRGAKDPEERQGTQGHPRFVVGSQPDSREGYATGP